MLPTDRFKLILSVYTVFIKDDQTLLLRRANTGFEDGNYGLVSGHADGNETATHAACREALEEAGLTLNPDELEFIHLMHRIGADERIDVFFKVSHWRGEPVNNEPEKCDDLSWFPVDKLPNNIIPYIKQALECHQKGITYSEFGWEK